MNGRRNASFLTTMNALSAVRAKGMFLSSILFILRAAAWRAKKRFTANFCKYIGLRKASFHLV
jgi:hypothetical protein